MSTPSLPAPPAAPLTDPLTPDDLHALVAAWAERLHVAVARVQVRPMRRKWGSISTAGTLTLAADLLALDPALAEYVVVHELLHLRHPDHGRAWRVAIGAWLPDWRAREARLQADADGPAGKG